MKMVGLDPAIYGNRKPSELSGGEQQRIGVIRALAADPKIILMDEPFSALDPISREKLQDEMLDLKKNLKKTTVFVTHDMREALKLADRICIMKDGEIVQIATPEELVENPENDFVREFVGDYSKERIAEIKLEDILQPVNKLEQDSSVIVPVSTPIGKLMEILSENESIQLERDGKVIGFIDRLSVMKYLSELLQKGSSK